MHKALRYGLTTLTAVAIVASIASVTAARRLSISNRAIRMTWNPIEFVSGEFVTRCAVTFEGSFHSGTIHKIIRALIGYVTRAAVQRPCTGMAEAAVYNGSENLGLGALASSMPWHLSYEGFSGSLPNITLVFVLARGMKFEARDTVFGFLATYGSSTENMLGAFKVGSGTVTGFTPEPTSRLRRTAGSAFLPAEVAFGGSATVTLLGNTSRITITLI